MKSRPSTKSGASRSGLLLLITLLLLIACCVGGFLWWQYYKTKPAYSLALLLDAAQRNDTTAFDGLVDIDQVVENFVSDAARKVSKDHSLKLPDAISNGLQPLAPITDRVKPLVREGIKRRVNELGEESAGKPLVLTTLGIALKADIFAEGNKAKVGIKHQDQFLEFGLELIDDRYWRVISVKDDALAGRVIAELAKEFDKMSPEGLRKPLTDILPPGVPTIP